MGKQSKPDFGQESVALVNLPLVGWFSDRAN
jgi:hypothetical protein